MILQRSLVAALSLSALMLGAVAQPSPAETVELKVVEKKLPTTTEYKFDRTMAAGRVRKAQVGYDGYIKDTYEIRRNDAGDVIGKRIIESEKVAPRAHIFHMGRAGYSTSRSGFTRSKVQVMNSTAYTPSAGLKNPTFKTAMGLPAKYGVIAVDPRRIKLGTLVFVEGYGFAVAADTGGAIKGNIIDVCVPTEREARNWGRRKVKVHIFDQRISR